MRRIGIGLSLFVLGLALGLLLGGQGDSLSNAPTSAPVPDPSAGEPVDNDLGEDSELARLRTEVAELRARAAGPVRVVEPVRVGGESGDPNHAAVRVTVVDADSRRLAGCRIEIVSRKGNVTGVDVISTGPDGTAFLDRRRPGDVDVVLPGVRGRRRLSVSLVAGRISEVALVAPGPGVRVQGRVIHHDAPAPRGDLVRLSSVGGTVTDSFEARTDPDGSFRFEGVEPGPAVLEVFVATGRIEVPVEIPAGGLSGLDVPVGVLSATGSVLDAETRAPLAGVRILVHRPLEAAEALRESRTDGNGRFRVFDIPDGTWSFWFSAEGFVGDSRAIVVRSGQAPETTVELAPAAEIELLLLDANGSPWSGRVRIDVTTGGMGHTTWASVGADGQVVGFGGEIPVGDCEVEVRSEDERLTGEARRRLERGTNSIRIRLE